MLLLMLLSNAPVLPAIRYELPSDGSDLDLSLAEVDQDFRGRDGREEDRALEDMILAASVAFEVVAVHGVRELRSARSGPLVPLQDHALILPRDWCRRGESNPPTSRLKAGRSAS